MSSESSRSGVAGPPRLQFSLRAVGLWITALAGWLAVFHAFGARAAAVALVLASAAIGLWAIVRSSGRAGQISLFFLLAGLLFGALAAESVDWIARRIVLLDVRVLNAASGRPVENAEVYIDGGPDPSAFPSVLTGPNGGATVGSWFLVEGTYRGVRKVERILYDRHSLVVQARGFQTAETPLPHFPALKDGLKNPATVTLVVRLQPEGR
jgi:hypothetical protein